ncbi:MAG TPA: terminase small subunit [Bacillota bacterium]|nr:terminase small subunit [Bacillota bacterium]
MAKLTPKQQCFVEEYLVDLNATAAAIRAGYSVKNAGKIGSQLLDKTRIKAAIDKALAARSRRTGINQDRVLLELAKVAFLNPTDVINMDEATIRGDANREDTATIASVKVKRIPTEAGDIVEREVKTYDKLKALELLGKHLGMFKDKLDVNLEVNLADLLKEAWDVVGDVKAPD